MASRAQERATRRDERTDVGAEPLRNHVEQGVQLDLSDVRDYIAPRYFVPATPEEALEVVDRVRESRDVMGDEAPEDAVEAADEIVARGLNYWKLSRAEVRELTAFATSTTRPAGMDEGDWQRGRENAQARLDLDAAIVERRQRQHEAATAVPEVREPAPAPEVREPAPTRQAPERAARPTPRLVEVDNSERRTAEVATAEPRGRRRKEKPAKEPRPERAPIDREALAALQEANPDAHYNVHTQPRTGETPRQAAGRLLAAAAIAYLSGTRFGQKLGFQPGRTIPEALKDLGRRTAASRTGRVGRVALGVGIPLAVDYARSRGAKREEKQRAFVDEMREVLRNELIALLSTTGALPTVEQAPATSATTERTATEQRRPVGPQRDRRDDDSRPRPPRQGGPRDDRSRQGDRAPRRDDRPQGNGTRAGQRSGGPRRDDQRDGGPRRDDQRDGGQRSGTSQGRRPAADRRSQERATV